MGGCCSVSISCGQFMSDVVNKVTECLCLEESYIHNIEKNLTALEKTMEELKARRNDLSRRVEREENRGLRRLDQIQVWLSNVETIESQVNGLLSVRINELQRLCLCGFCSKNLKLSYRYGKQVFMKLEEVENLKSNGDFEEVSQQAPISEVVEKPIQPEIIGQETVLEKAWNSLIEDGVGMLGLYGMGGVGKTTLLEQINNKFKGGAFDVVIWVVVSKDLQIQKIQEKVAKKLGLDMEDWNNKDEDQKKEDIHSVLRRKKFVLLLDDIWAKVDLKHIGVPFPNRENGSKVVFTTRSKEVCGRMGVDDPMEVQCLYPEDALDLFRKKIGQKTLGSHPDLPELAKVVAEKCRGLPLALNVIGETMSFKRTVEEWHRAVRVLTSNATTFSGMEDKILPILKYSYDDLKGKQVKSSLQYCALFPEDARILKDDLIEKWICEGIIDDNEGIGNAMEQGYEIICSLVRSSLLMQEKFIVYMHDVVREMALWIASDFGKHKNNFVVHAGGGLCKMPKLMNWNAVNRLSLMVNKIDHISGNMECLKLKTLFLQRNKISLGNISGEFFKSMLKLVVLDLSHNGALSELPDEISELVSLKYLNISSTSIDCLPVGLQKLKNLTELAKVVAEKCRGLPLALNVIGETMSFKRTVEEWHRAVRVLTSNATTFSGMEDKILPILKYSYDDLKGKQVKSSLQYCALFPEDARILKDDLIEKWICEGIIDDNEGIRNAMEQGYEIICSLVRSSLLMEKGKLKVYMHDVVREMALWIASDFVVYAGGGLCEMPKLKNWNAVKRVSLMANKINHISSSMECLELTTLFLQRNKISFGNNIYAEFFKSMPRLVVLDLSDNEALSELPDGISELVSLKYLNISRTSIKCLPVGLQKLKNLIHLDLEWTQQLSSVIGISALLNLRVLKLYSSGVAYSSKAKEELKVLEHLEILTISINSDSGLDEFLSSQNLMCCTEVLEIWSCQLESSDIWCLARIEKLRQLYLKRCGVPEIKMDTASITREMVSPLQNLKNAFFLSLSTIYLYYCVYPKDLTWLMFTPNLTMLFIFGGYQVEEILNKKKSCEGETSRIDRSARN